MLFLLLRIITNHKVSVGPHERSIDSGDPTGQDEPDFNGTILSELGKYLKVIMTCVMYDRMFVNCRISQLALHFCKYAR